MLRNYFLFVGCILLSACATRPVISRSNHAELFELQKQGRISPEKIQDFADCLMDGFGSSHFSMTNIHSNVQKREDGFRV